MDDPKALMDVHLERHWKILDDPEWLARAKADWNFKRPRRYQQLVRLLLQAGGVLALVGRREPDIEALLKFGRFWIGKDARLVKLASCRCHDNAARLSEERGYRIATGYGLSEDGLWRQHSWCMGPRGGIVETTVKRVLYYGIVLNEDDAATFSINNRHE